MRRFPKSLMVAMSLAMCVVAGQASAGQGRQRSAPPSSSSRGSSSQGSQPSQSDRGRSQAQSERREAPAPQSSRNNDARSNSSRGNDNRDSGRYDNRNAAPQRQAESQRQAVPAPRDRYTDVNRNGRDDRNENRGGSFLGGLLNGLLGNDRYDSRRYGSYGYDTSRYDNGRYDSYAPNYRYSGSRVIIAPREPMRFSRSWFSFRPQIRLGVGLTMGYPIDFPTWYDPYMVGTPGYVRPYMPYGGVSFDVEPRDAELWVDGEYIGRVSDYTSYDPPLTLVAGRHRVELTGRNYQSIAFDITVVAGQVIPYQGTLPYYR